MKRPFRFTFFMWACFAVTAIIVAETLLVKVQTTNLRKEPKFYAQTLAVLKAGERLEKVSSQGDWVKVRTAGGIEGWIHSSAVQTKKFDLLAMDKSLKTQASADEVALAGKGFNKQVEDKYKAQHSEISFAEVEKMLKMKVTPSQIRSFLKQGKLGEFGGGK
ncbi:SH3 domain-containing protein [Acidobacteriota bacterium]